MMGERRVIQEALFYEFSLERHVPGDHLLRSIDPFVDLSDIRAHLRPFYSDIGDLPNLAGLESGRFAFVISADLDNPGGH
jgi:hypothetical protein